MGLQNVNLAEPMIELHEPGHDADSAVMRTMTGRHLFHLTLADDVDAPNMHNNYKTLSIAYHGHCKRLINKFFGCIKNLCLFQFISPECIHCSGLWKLTSIFRSPSEIDALEKFLVSDHLKDISLKNLPQVLLATSSILPQSRRAPLEITHP